MGLSNKQIGHIVEEIFEKVSQPIINENNRLLETADYDRDHEFLKEYDLYQEYQKQMNEIQEKMAKMRGEWANKNIGILPLGFYPFNNNRELIIKQLKIENTALRKYPERTDIERQVILNENNDIPKLIQMLIEKFTSQ